MDLTIANMKVGEKIWFGEYGVGSTPVPILWIKATRDNKFITEFVLDNLVYDAPEPARSFAYRYSGYEDYETSNIRQYLNSQDVDWFMPASLYDKPPNDIGRRTRIDYSRHAGFLNAFEEYEIDSMESEVRIPDVAEIAGMRQFELFKRKGIRGKPSDDLLSFGHFDTYYYGYMTRTSPGNGRIHEISRSSSVKTISTSGETGLRPVCKLKAQTKITKCDDGCFRLIPYNLPTQDSTEDTGYTIEWLLGLQ